MKNLFFAFSLFTSFLINHRVFAYGPEPKSPLVLLLAKYAEGRKTLNYFNSTGILKEVTVTFVNHSELLQIAGHSGGGVKQDPQTGKYEIIIVNDLPPEQQAHALTHQAQHVRDEMDFDQYLVTHQNLRQVGLDFMKGLTLNSKKTNFVLYGLFCQERRAYETNIQLEKQGLKFSTREAITSPVSYIHTNYLKKFKTKFSLTELSKIEKTCINAKSFSAFMNINASHIL